MMATALGSSLIFHLILQKNASKEISSFLFLFFREDIEIKDIVEIAQDLKANGSYMRWKLGAHWW